MSVHPRSLKYALPLSIYQRLSLPSRLLGERNNVVDDEELMEGRWNHIKMFLKRNGPFTHPYFEPCTESLHSSLRVGIWPFF
uniref:Uncharacterized protein n=1 Tax=Vombatus ursinus TaxID=29139 RepID=A0A4X2KH27_VOMUR